MDSLIRMPRSLVGLTFSGITVVEPPVVLDDHIRYFFRGVDKYRGETMSDDDKQKIGDAGEEAVLRFEIARLRHFGREDLAKKVSKAQREDRSYDIDSFDLDEQRIFIEVKTTQRVGTFPFFLRRPQLAACKLQPENYRLYRLFEFGESTKMTSKYGLMNRSISAFSNFSISSKSLIRSIASKHCVPAAFASSVNWLGKRPKAPAFIRSSAT